MPFNETLSSIGNSLEYETIAFLSSFFSRIGTIDCVTRSGSRGSILTLELFPPSISRTAMSEMVNLIYHSDGSFVIRTARPFLDLHAKLLTSC